MSKSPEEGKIWEWRAFGKLSDDLVSRVRAYPIRMGIKDIQGEDLYLISPDSDQNVKLRRSQGGWVLKFKLLFETRTAPIELYSESAEYTYTLPVPSDRVREAAVLLATALPRTIPGDDEHFDLEKLITALAESSPPIVETTVSKVRSQFAFENGWFELAEVDFEQLSTQSISVNSRDLQVVKEMTKQLDAGNLEAMNYVEACRRWG
ncbi:MAG TPA: hypothetical protein VKN18_16420 [Blastocatellia bacterium]|nr:hypothetical protein [Blastocatellia bacterium]